MVNLATHESAPYYEEEMAIDPAQRIAEQFVHHCFDPNLESPRDGAAQLFQRFRDVQFNFIGRTTHQDRQHDSYPPGVELDGFAYGECCLVAGDTIEQQTPELLIVRYDPAVKDRSKPEHWLVLCYELTTGRCDRLELDGADITQDSFGAHARLSIKYREPDNMYQSGNGTWLDLTINPDGYAHDGASLEVPDYYARGFVQRRSYTVDYAQLRAEIVKGLDRYVINPEALLSGEGEVTESLIDAHLRTNPRNYELAS